MVRFPDLGTSRLILVGDSEYDHETLGDLPAVEQSLDELRSILTNPQTGGFLAEHCLRPDARTPPRDLAASIQRHAAQAEDTLTIWFIGHGLFDIESRKLHLAVSGTNPADLYWTSLPFDQLRRAFLGSPAEVKLLMLDCCFSGRALAEMQMGDSELSELISEEVAVEGTYIITACSGRDIALALPGERFTVFSGAVIETLRSAVPLTLGDLFRQVSRSLRGSHMPAPTQAANGTAADLALVRPLPPDPSAGAADGFTFMLYPPDDPAPGGDAAFTESLSLAYAHADGSALPAGSAEADVTLGPLDAAEREVRIGALLVEAETASHPDSDVPHELVIAKLRRIITEMVHLGPDHPSVLKARDMHALCLGRAGRYAEAVRLSRRLVDARAKLYGPEHSEVLASRHNLAYMTGLAGDSAAAVSQFQAIAEDRKRLLGDWHGDTILSMDGLAYWTALNGDLVNSTVMYRSLYEEIDWHYGPDDERTLRFLSRLAWVQGMAFDANGALESYIELVERWTSLNGTGCPEVVRYARARDYWAGKVNDEI